MTRVDWDAYALSHPQNKDHFAHEPVQQHRSEVLAKRARGTVLDVGGGDGYQAELMQAQGAKVAVLDVSPKRIERVQEKGIEGIVGSADDLPFDDDTFTTVVLAEVLEHLGDPGTAIREAFRVSNQRVVISLPLKGWADPTHEWRVTLDHCIDPNEKDPTKGEQIVLTFRKGKCWPHDYYKNDRGWTEQMEGR
jgi:ubiquinone/menaquinone biosynthesis C-methylase UbiE